MTHADFVRDDALSYADWRSHDVFCTVQADYIGDEVLLVSTPADHTVSDDYTPTTQVLVEVVDVDGPAAVYRYTPLRHGPLTRAQDASLQTRRAA